MTLGKMTSFRMTPTIHLNVSKWRLRNPSPIVSSGVVAPNPSAILILCKGLGG